MSDRDWERDLAWFVMTYMSTDKPFHEAFAEYFKDQDIIEFDALTDTLFRLKELGALIEADKGKC